MLTFFFGLNLVGKEIRDRFSGAVEAFSRKHPTTCTARDLLASRNSDDGPLPKPPVNTPQALPVYSPVFGSVWLNRIMQSVIVLCVMLYI